jgi:multiple sugar transport system ATP-binding protein
MASLVLEGLVRHHPGAARPALNGLSLTVKSGEVLVVVGPSGCGKSTALRLVAGLDRPDAGSIRIGERDVTHVPPQDRDVAMVFQGYALYPHLTVRENIAFPLKMRGISGTEQKTRVGEAAELLGLTALLARRPGELSGGERQRVAMGRALVRAPKAFLFDEPLSNLDAALRTELRGELAALVRRVRTTSVYVTHDQVEAMTMGDRIAVLQRGQLEQQGSPREVYEKPATTFVAGFVGSPAMALLELEVTGESASRQGLSVPLPAPLRGLSGATLGLRPEHVRLISEGDLRPGEVAAPAEVALVEPLGAETLVFLDVAGRRLATRVPGFSSARLGEAAAVALDVARAHWFDTATGRRVETSA